MGIEEIDREIATHEAAIAALRKQRDSEAQKTYGQRVAERLVRVSKCGCDFVHRIYVGSIGCTDGRYPHINVDKQAGEVVREIAAAIDKARADRTEEIAKWVETTIGVYGPATLADCIRKVGAK
jgi:hypothetical protein